MQRQWAVFHYPLDNFSFRWVGNLPLIVMIDLTLLTNYEALMKNWTLNPRLTVRLRRAWCRSVNVTYVAQLALHKFMVNANDDLEIKETHNLPSNKRLLETDEQISDKRIKTEDDNSVESSQVPDAIPGGSVTSPACGVKRIAPCPPECRPSHRDFALYREQLVKKVIDELASEGKRVEGQVRFL